MMREPFNSRYFPLIFIPIAFLFTLVYSWATSPLYLGDGLDSSIFKTIGLGMVQGQMPYTDLFDHKGGILFLIQALGWLILPGRWGLFAVQVVFLSVTLFFMFRTACLYLDEKKGFLATLSGLFLYVLFMESGNQCESYALPFMAMSLYLALKFTRNSQDSTHPLLYSLVYGISFAFIFWIRPNDAVSQVGSIMAGIFILLIVRKQFKNAILNALVFLAGCAVVTTPLMVYFESRDCLLPLLDGTFLYNLKYVSDNGLPSAQMILMPSFIFGFLIWMSVKRDNKDMAFIFIPMLILTLMFIGKRDYAHYLIIIVPAAVVMFSMVIREKWRIFMGILILAIAIASVRQHKYVFKSFETRDQIERFYTQTRRIISNVPENERSQIWNLNLLTASNDDSPNVISTLGAMLDSRVTPCNRIFVYFHVETFGKEETAAANMPKWILADPTCNQFEEHEEFLRENYTIIDSTDGSCTGDMTLYKRIER